MAPFAGRCKQCKGGFLLLTHISLLDCSGHDILMETILNGAAVEDAAMLLIAGNETCPLTIRAREDVDAFFIWGGEGRV